MVEGRRRDHWLHTSALIAAIHNTDPRYERIDPSQVDPYRKPPRGGRRRTRIKGSIHDLKIFLHNKGNPP